MLLAFELLSKYKKDKDFIQKDIKQVKKQAQTITEETKDHGLPKAKAAYIDPLLTQEERHRLIAEKRQIRKQQQV